MSEIKYKAIYEEAEEIAEIKARLMYPAFRKKDIENAAEKLKWEYFFAMAFDNSRRILIREQETSGT